MPTPALTPMKPTHPDADDALDRLRLAAADVANALLHDLRRPQKIALAKAMHRGAVVVAQVHVPTAFVALTLAHPDGKQQLLAEIHATDDAPPADSPAMN